MSINRVVLVGNLTRDPELKYSPQGIPVARMGIAVNRVSKNEQGDYEVDFFNIIVFRRTAEFAQTYLKKGSKVALDGRLQTNSWVDQASGQKRTVFEIIADNIQSLDRRQDGEMSGNEMDGDRGMSAAPVAAVPAPVRNNPAPVAAASGGRGNARNAAPADDELDESDPFADE